MESNLIVGLVVVIGIVLFITFGIFSYIADKKRREALRDLASKLGLSFNESQNYDIAIQYSFLNKLTQGDNRYVFNTFSGVYRGEQVVISDYHYETHSTDSKGRQRTNHHYLSLFALQMPTAFPELTIVTEGILSKIAQSFGYDDIDFESHEFSRTFCVRSRDKKSAYAICNARMIEYLLGNKDLSIEIERNTLALIFDSQLAIEQVETNLNRMLEIRSRMPDYLFTRI